jgi:hypothetical protein
MRGNDGARGGAGAVGALMPLQWWSGVPGVLAVLGVGLLLVARRRARPAVA